MVSLQNIMKSYDDKEVIKNFNLKVEKNELVAICGRSGSGKTTLLNMIGLLEKPTSGSIEVCGMENPKLNSRVGIQILRYKIGYIFQNCALVDDETVDFNLNIALKYVKSNDKNELKKAALKEVGLEGFEKKKIYTLSGGEQQRVAVARLLLKPCELILADEPTGSLDNDNRDNILGLIHLLRDRGKTIIVVTHDDKVRKSCDRAVEL